MPETSGLGKFALAYHRRYIKAGKATPFFHVIAGVATLGILIEAKVHNDRVKDPKYHGEH